MIVWVQIPALSLTSCVILGKLLKFSVPQWLLIYEMGMVIPISQGCCKD